MSDLEKVNNNGWYVAGTPEHAQDSYIQVGREMAGDGIIMPIVPTHLRDQITRHAEASAITTDVKALSMDTYSMRSWPVPSFAQKSKDDLLLFSFAGHGLSSYAIGLVARVSNILIQQQATFGGVYAHRDRDRVRVNQQTKVWNSMVSKFEALSNDSPNEYILQFSSFRSIAHVSRRPVQLIETGKIDIRNMPPKVQFEVCVKLSDWRPRSAPGLHEANLAEFRERVVSGDFTIDPADCGGDAHFALAKECLFRLMAAQEEESKIAELLSEDVKKFPIGRKRL